ncbi:MAG: HNH endonuclease signature motif containing protein [Sedimentisphaerales bacterium]
MPLPKRKIDYLMFKVQGRIIKVDPDIYRKIFNTQRNPPNRKYNGNITSVYISLDGYPVIVIGKKPSRYVPLARFVMNAKKGQIVDHKNRDPLDNRRSQLRLVTKRQNNLNKKCINGTGFFGVFIKHPGKRAYCTGRFLAADGKELRFQLPDSPANRVIAAFARDRFVLQAGEEEYAPLNFPCWQYEPFRSILLNEDLKKYKTKCSANSQLEFGFMKNLKK